MKDQIKLKSSYIFVKRNIFYFSRRVPGDLQHHYQQVRIVQSLKTKYAKEAVMAANLLSNQLEQLWFQLRVKKQTESLSTLYFQQSSNEITLDEALTYYLKHRGKGRSAVFHKHANLYVSYLKTAVPNIIKIKNYKAKDVLTFRNWLQTKGLSNGSVRKSFATIRAIINFVIQEHALEIRNVFKGIQLPSEQDDIKKRVPISTDDIKQIQMQCMTIDDDIRWLIALISDTGMRLSEAVGLKLSDLCLEGNTPHIIVQPYSHRPLKTLSSQRIIPLVGASLWSAQQIKENTSGGSYCFPRYCKNDSCNSNSASATLNKWIKTIMNKGYVVHGFRHSFRDRLRAVGAQSEMIDQLGGWSLKSVGQKYGSGYDLLHTHQVMRLISSSIE